MDLKDDEKSRKCGQPQNSRYYKTNTGQLFVKNLNPYYSVRGNTGDVRENLKNKRMNEEFINIFDDKARQTDPNKISSTERINKILKHYALNNNYNEHMYLNEECDAYHAEHQRPHGPVASMSTNKFLRQYSFRSRDLFETPRYDYELKIDDCNQESDRNEESPTNEMMRDHINVVRNEQSEKSTYCRPIENVYNQEFVYRTLQKNTKLQKIVRKLVIEREREKQREAWNNYINDLKNKHEYYSNEPSRISPQYVPGDHNTPEMIDDFYNMRLNWCQSNSGHHLLEDIDGAHDSSPSSVHSRNAHNYDSTLPPDVSSCIFDNNRFCYPSCSQTNMLKFNKERQGHAYNWRSRPSGRYFRGNSVVGDNNRVSETDSIQVTARPYFPGPLHTKKPLGAPGTITTANLPLVNEEDYKELNVSKADNMYYPYYTEIKPSAQEETNEKTQYVLVPIKRKSLKRHTHTGVPYTQKVTKLDKDVNVPSRHESLRNNKEHKMVEKSCKNDAGTEDLLRKKESFRENFKKVSDNIMKLKAKIQQSEEKTKIKSLATIEEKIDCLMKSMNSIMTDIQANKNNVLCKKNEAVSACQIVSTSRTMLNRHSSDPYSYNNEEYVVQSCSRSFTVSEVLPNELRRHTGSSISKMETILIEEMKKSDKAKSDIAEILNLRDDRSCSLQLTFDIPTKERSTEVTDSLYKTRYKADKKNLFEKRPLPDQRAMTIAVNTDPLGLLALLRVSTETVKKILSYVPNLNYHSYLSMLPLLLPSKRCAPHYTCNICGATFSQPSLLSAHVKQHNSGRTR